MGVISRLFLIIGSLVFLGIPSFVLSEETLETKKIEVNFFYGEGCFHCLKKEKFLEKIEKKYPQVEIKKYEVWYNLQNQKLFQEFIRKYNIPSPVGIPLTIIGQRYFVGYQSDETTGKEIESYILALLEEKKIEDKIEKIKIPIFGELNISQLSLPLLTITLAALDGFNPCAMWVLLFLISLLINVRSRKKLFLVGGTFILTSGIVYFLILVGWLKLFLAIGYFNLTRILIGIFALGFGLWQLKEFLTFNPGVCKVLGLKPKGFKAKLETGLKTQAEKLIDSPLTLAMMGGIIILAFGVNLIEFFCSPGLPAIFTKILTLNQLPTFSYYLYLLLYTFIFMLDDLIVFSLAVITLSKIGFTQKYNYWATLIGGLLIFILGLLLVFKPEFLMFG